MKINQVITEKSVSKQQQKFMGMVYAAKKGEKPASPDVAKAAKGMSKSDAKDFAKTKHKGLPQKVGETTGAPLGTVSTAPDASGKVKIKTPTGTEIETNKDALLPGAKPGTVQMKPDAAADTLKPGTQVVSTEDMEESDYDAVDSAESYKAWLKKSAAADGLSPEQTAELEKMMVTDPDGSIDMDATMVKTMKAFADLMPQLYEMFVEWLGILEKAKADPALWSSYTPEEQKSIDEAIASGKAQLPELAAGIKQMQSQTPELDKFAADRKAAGTTMKIPAKAPAAPPMEELGRIKQLAGIDEATEQAIPNIPPMPDVTGLQPGQVKDIGNGQRVEIGKDGNIHYSGGFGIVVYNPQGKPLTYQSPNFAGTDVKQDLNTGNKTMSYNSGPLSVSQTTNAKGQTTASSGSYTLGGSTVKMDQEYKDGQPTIQTRTASGDLADTPIVKNQDVYDRAKRSIPTAENQQLEAMLRIAGL